MTDIGMAGVGSDRTGPPGGDAGERIVVGVDLSPVSVQVVRAAARLADELGARLDVVHAYDRGPSAIWHRPDLLTDADAVAHVTALLDEVLAGALGPDASRASVVPVLGDPATVLVERSRTALLLVVGGRPGPGLGRLMLGSAARHCVERAAVPVLVVPDAAGRRGAPGHHDAAVPDRDTASAGPSAGRVVVGVDGSASAREALRWAGVLAAVEGVGLDAVTTWERPAGAAEAVRAAAEPPQRAAGELLEREIAAAFDGDTPADLRALVLEGLPAHHLLDRSRGAAYLVLGRRGLSGLSSFMLGSVSVKCANNARCPVLVVHTRVADIDAPDRPDPAARLRARLRPVRRAVPAGRRP